MKKINNALLITFTIFSCMVRAQDINPASPDTSWKRGGFISISFNQVSLTNWAAGGQNSLSGTFIGKFYANYEKGKASWDNNIDLAYGFLESGAARAQKNLDRIELNTKYGHQATENLYYSSLINVKTQFAPGYNYPNDSVKISHFAAPAYVTASLGMDYKLGTYFTLFLSPATGRLVIVEDQRLADAGQFGVDPATYDSQGNKLSNGKMLRTEFGAYLRARFQRNIVKSIGLMSELALFNNYTDPKVYQRGNVNVDWQVMLTVKSGKFLTFSVFTQLLYDNNISIPTYGNVIVGNTIQNEIISSGPKTQFQEAVGVGLSYKF